MKRNNKLHNKKQEITLMTLLANDAAKESRHILKKYNKPNARNHADLEVKLGELYFDKETDKKQLEKELAEIHPHKDWIVRTLDLVKKEDVKCEKCEDNEKIKETEKDQIEQIKNAVSESVGKFSDFNGSKEAPQPTIVTTPEQKGFSSIEIIGMVGAIGLIGLTFIVVSKNLTK